MVWSWPRVPSTAAALSMLVLVASIVSPQAAPPSSSPPPPVAVQPPAQQIAPDGSAPQQGEPAREENPGLFNEMGKLFDKTLSLLPSVKSPSETIDDLNARAKDAAKDATDGLTRLTKPSSMVTGRMACVVAANGAPDCKAGADRLCQSSGYKEGSSLNTDAAEKCSAKVYLPGHKREPGDCRTENYVTRALCH